MENIYALLILTREKFTCVALRVHLLSRGYKFLGVEPVGLESPSSKSFSKSKWFEVQTRHAYYYKSLSLFSGNLLEVGIVYGHDCYTSTTSLETRNGSPANTTVFLWECRWVERKDLVADKERVSSNPSAQAEHLNKNIYWILSSMSTETAILWKQT